MLSFCEEELFDRKLHMYADLHEVESAEKVMAK